MKENQHQDSRMLEVFDPTKNPWEKIRDEIMGLEKDIFGEDAYDEETLRSGFENSNNTIIIMRDANGKAIGLTWAMPAKTTYEENADWEPFQGRNAFDDTAYIFNTGLLPEFQGKGLVAKLYEALSQELLKKGYKRLHRDSNVVNGLAENILKNNQGRIINNFEHDSPYGKQMFIDTWIVPPEEKSL